ncbi:MAG: Smr/MutS family protein [Candidatus Methanoperedens sp.]|nr:Smr/MutS family protein [Candidatus Methanoperedens sp.]
MAWFQVDIFEKCVEVDLHGYSHMTAILVARKKIKEAYEHGFRQIKFIHGGASIRSKEDGGSIKFALRSMLKNSELSRWVMERDSKNHKIRDGSIIFALRVNDAPIDKEWKEIPMSEYWE